MERYQHLTSSWYFAKYKDCLKKEQSLITPEIRKKMTTMTTKLKARTKENLCSFRTAFHRYCFKSERHRKLKTYFYRKTTNAYFLSNEREKKFCFVFERDFYCMRAKPIIEQLKCEQTESIRKASIPDGDKQNTRQILITRRHTNTYKTCKLFHTRKLQRKLLSVELEDVSLQCPFRLNRIKKKENPFKRFHRLQTQPCAFSIVLDLLRGFCFFFFAITFMVLLRSVTSAMNTFHVLCFSYFFAACWKNFQNKKLFPLKLLLLITQSKPDHEQNEVFKRDPSILTT